MSLAIPKKKRIIIIIIILSSRIQTDLDNNVTDTVYETILDQLGEAKPVLLDVPENNWNSDQQDAWDAIEAIAQAFDPANVSQPTEEDLANLSDALGEALERC